MFFEHSVRNVPSHPQPDVRDFVANVVDVLRKPGLEDGRMLYDLCARVGTNPSQRGLLLSARQPHPFEIYGASLHCAYPVEALETNFRTSCEAKLVRTGPYPQ